MVTVLVVVLCQPIHLVTASFALRCCVSRTISRGGSAPLVLKANDDDDDDNESTVVMGRSRFLESATSGILTVVATFCSIPNSALAGTTTTSSYSTNARNMERLSLGDLSGGSVYNNYPKTEASKKRRAMQGCKVPSARRVAAETISLNKSLLTEKDCNMRVVSGETEFMLEAIRTLECPTCAYGIDPM